MSDRVDGFFWCDGTVMRPDLWMYNAIILDRSKRGPRKTREFRGDDPDDLRQKLAEAGYEVDGDLRQLCESAPRSPHIGRKRVSR